MRKRGISLVGFLGGLVALLCSISAIATELYCSQEGKDGDLAKYFAVTIVVDKSRGVIRLDDDFDAICPLRDTTPELYKAMCKGDGFIVDRFLELDRNTLDLSIATGLDDSSPRRFNCEINQSRI